jgi:cell division protein FtsI/penicillin-binding protein 2
MNLTTALAKSNNPFFANIGDKLGFQKVHYYAKLLGLGERSGFEIQGESPGIFPAEKPSGVSVGLMTSFGEAIGLTPLQLTAMASAIGR